MYMRTYENRGWLYDELGEHEKAEEYYNKGIKICEKTLELNPDFKEVRECLDRIIENKNKINSLTNK